MTLTPAGYECGSVAELTLPDAQPIEAWRCIKCRKLLARVALAPGSVVIIKCRCNYVNHRQIVPVIDTDESRV